MLLRLKIYLCWTFYDEIVCNLKNVEIKEVTFSMVLARLRIETGIAIDEDF